MTLTEQLIDVLAETAVDQYSDGCDAEDNAASLDECVDKTMRRLLTSYTEDDRNAVRKRARWLAHRQ